jgi:hypothetical protein
LKDWIKSVGAIPCGRPTFDDIQFISSDFDKVIEYSQTLFRYAHRARTSRRPYIYFENQIIFLLNEHSFSYNICGKPEQ